VQTLFSNIVQRSTSPTFIRSFALILVVEAVTILTAWLLLDSNVSKWMSDKAAQAVRISRTVAAAEDWSLVDTVPKNPSPLFDTYRKLLTKYSHRFFPQNEGDVSLAVIRNGRTYVIDPYDQVPMDLVDKANKWELAAYATGKTTYNDVPYSDNTGTYIGAQTPIYRNGRIVGLAAAEYDSATLAEFQGIVRRAFWLSVLPAILLALGLAYVLAALFVEPMEIFRRIDETAARRAGRPPQSDVLSKLSPREWEVAELVWRGRKNKDIAEALFVSPETVKQHLKNIKEKTGFARLDLAVQVEAGRRSVVQEAPAPA
jgi:DNA-binding CsgD family transcriptional regulator